jgi:hypothetical protein
MGTGAVALCPASVRSDPDSPIRLWSVLVLPDRFDHFQHCNRELLVWKRPSDSPALPVIEVDRRCIQLENAKPKCSTTATDDFSFTLCQQSVANVASPILAKDPPITNPFFVRQYHADDPGAHDGDPGEAPILLVNGKRWRSPKTIIYLVDNGLHYCPDRVVLMRLWPTYDHFDHQLPI